MPSTTERPLTPKEIESILAEASDDAQVTVFCIDGVIVEIPFREALIRLPYAVMMMQRSMYNIITAQGKEALFLSPMNSDMLLADLNKGFTPLPDSPWSVGALEKREMVGKKLENINKTTVNAVSAMFGEEPVFGPNEDGVLRG